MKNLFLSKLERFDHWLLRASGRFSGKAARIAIFLVFFWFGLLKVVGLSPADALVEALLLQTMPFFGIDGFLVFLGLYEMIIGLLFLFPRFTRVAILLLVSQMITTFFPLVLLPQLTWHAWLVPTMEGQYILKNTVILALAMGIGASLKPLSITQRHS